MGAGENLILEVTNSATNQTTSYPFGDASFDATQLDPGLYQLRITKSLTDTNGTRILNRVVADLVISPLTLTQAGQSQLMSNRVLTTVNLDSAADYSVEITTSGGYTPREKIFTFYDANGHKRFSNENGGVWTRYFYDARGNLTREVRFQYRDPVSGQFLDEIPNLSERPQLADAPGNQTVRVTERHYDAAGNLLQESLQTDSYGALTNEWQYDRFGNTTQETSYKGIAGQEQQTRYRYDAMNHLSEIELGPFTYRDEQNATQVGSVFQRYTYDAGGNRTTQTNERGYTERYRYDAHNRLVDQWDFVKVTDGVVSGASTLKTEYLYDHFSRVETKRQIDLTKPLNDANRVHDLGLGYNHYDEVTRVTDPGGLSTTMHYDRAGNLDAETNARDFTEFYQYDGENRVIGRTDRTGNHWRTVYDALGYKFKEIDGNGRITQYDIGPLLFCLVVLFSKSSAPNRRARLSVKWQR